MGPESVTTSSQGEKTPRNFSQPIFRVKKLPGQKFDQFFDPKNRLGELPKGFLTQKIVWENSQGVF